jgi:hypothetical protein
MASLYPSTPLPTADEACSRLLSLLESGDIQSLIPLISRASGASLDVESCILAAHEWWQFRAPGQPRSPLRLDLTESGSAAACFVQVFTTASPDRFIPRVLVFEKSDEGWLWSPNPPQETRDSFSDWKDQCEKRWKNDWQTALLQDCPVIDTIEASAAIDEDALRKLIGSLLTALHSGNVADALGLTARLGAADSDSALIRNLGYELAGAAKDTKPPELDRIHRGNLWSAVGSRTYPAGKTAFPLYPIVQTPHGPRVLLEVDLRETGSRSRDFLNKTAIDRLTKIHPDAAEDLKTVFRAHRESVMPEKDP